MIDIDNITEVWSNERIRKLGNHWAKRANHISNLLIEKFKDNFSVLDIGCGTMMVEKYLLRNCIKVKYFPCDIIKRDDRTIVFDLNKSDINELPTSDVVVLLGTMEYVENIEKFISEIKLKTKYLIFTYRKNWNSNAHKSKIFYPRDKEEILNKIIKLNLKLELLNNPSYNTYIIN